MSLCSTASADSDFLADYFTFQDEFSNFESGFALDDFVISSKHVSADVAVIKFDADLFQNLELSTSTKSTTATTINVSKRKWNDIDDELVNLSQNKKQCHDTNKPLMAPYILSALHFDIDIPIEYLVKIVNEFLQIVEFCAFDYDAAKFTWIVTIMGSNNFCHGKIQVYELHQFGQPGYIVEADLSNGDQDLFQLMYDNLSEHVQNIPCFRCSFTSDDEFNIFSQDPVMPCKEKILSICNSLLKASLLTRSEEEENRLFENVTFVCSALDTFSKTPSMKPAALDASYMLRALVRTTEAFSDLEDLSSIKSLARWVLVYSVRCIVMLLDFDPRCLAELKSPGYKNFRVWLAQQQQDMQASTMQSTHELKLLENMVQLLLSSLPSTVSSSAPQVSLIEVASPQFKRNTKSVSSLLSVENRYHCCTEVATPVRGISCSG